MTPARAGFRPWTISLRLLLVVTTVAGLLLAWGVRQQSARERAEREIVPVQWDIATGENVLWRTQIGSQTYSSPVFANGKIFIGTNNAAAFDNQLPETVDLGVLLCLDAATGKFLWQHINRKLPTGRVNDWPYQGVCSTATVEKDRLWYMNNRGELICLDTEGFLDGENDGVQNESRTTSEDADIIWRRDLIADYGVHPHNMSCGQCALLGNRLFFVAPNGVDVGHRDLPAPHAPAFLCLDKRSGGLLWKDDSSSPYIMHGQWGSPVVARLGGVNQAIFPGGDGWLYSFAAEGDGKGGAKLLWKFDCNPKKSLWMLGGRGERNNLIQKPTIHQGKVLVAMGQDPEHGEGPGRLLCIDPTKRGDVSAELLMRRRGDVEEIAPRRRRMARYPHNSNQESPLQEGEFVASNPNSALVWVYRGAKYQRRETYSLVDDEQEFSEVAGASQGDVKVAPVYSGSEEFGRSISRVAARDNLVLATDIAGFVHCVEMQTGKVLWTHDMWAASWTSPIIAGQHIYLGNEDGYLMIYRLSGDPLVALKLGTAHAELDMSSSIYATPLVHNNVLYIATRNEVFAIKAKGPGP